MIRKILVGADGSPTGVAGFEADLSEVAGQEWCEALRTAGVVVACDSDTVRP